MKFSKIEWCDHTWNAWWGCTRVSPGCEHCYAEAFSHRLGHDEWGPGKPRRRNSDHYWGQPYNWNRTKICRKCGAENSVNTVQCKSDLCDSWEFRRPRVFSASMSDWLDHEVPIQWLADMLVTVHQTPNLVWLLLSKRPEQFRIRLLEANGALAIAGDLDKFEECPKMRAAFWIAEWLKGNPPDNVLIGTTVEDKIRQKRIVDLLNIPAAGRFLSCEPLLGHVNILANEEGLVWPAAEAIARGQGIDWVICGGESGQGARPMHENWARGLRDQCKAAGVPFLFKQWGEWVPLAQFDGNAKILESKYPWSTSTDEKPFDTIGPCMVRVGKHAAGRLLDHKEWTQFPGVAS